MMLNKKGPVFCAGTLASLAAVAVALGMWQKFGANASAGKTPGPQSPTLSPADEPTEDTPPVVLPEAERLRIWQIEHAVVLMDFRFWPKLASAIRDRNRDGMRCFFRRDARVELIRAQDEMTESLGFGYF